MRLTATLLLLLAVPALAQTPGDCTNGRAQADLDVSGVFARAFNTGSLFYGDGTTYGNGYLVPAHTGRSPLFVASIWVGGTIGGDLRVAGSTYDRFEFWPGPLHPGAVLPDPEDCSPFDRIWVVSAEDVATYDETGVATTDLAEWPVHLGAEVIDGDGFPNNYDLAAGDRPRVYGSQTAFWVMNDVGNEHRKTLTEPIGLEVQVTAFSVVSGDDAFDQATFYRYRLVNRNALPFEDARFSLFQDQDLGDATNDYVGVDTTRHLAFVYNARPNDNVYGTPPAFGVDFLSSGLGAHTWFIGGGVVGTGDPVNGEEMYNHLQGLWSGGVPFTEGGLGYQTDGDTTTFAFAGDPVTRAFWSETNIDGNGNPTAAGDRRSVASAPAFRLDTGKAKDVWLAMVFGQGEDHLDSVTELRAASDAVQAAYDDGSLFETVLPNPPITLPTPTALTPTGGDVLLDEVPLSWAPVPGAAYYRVEVALEPGLGGRRVYYTDEPTLSLSGLPDNDILKVYWRVRAEEEDGSVSPWSDVHPFVYYRYESDLFSNGAGIVETRHPYVKNVCEGVEGDPGCEEYGWNTVYADPNATGDYALVSATTLANMVQADVIEEEDFELRFTERCATAGNCLGAYVRDGALIASVPFELWNIGDVYNPTDDVRMIPLLRPSGPEPVADWADAFTAERTLTIGGEEVEVGVTERVYWMMPDRPDGYALFEAAARAFGGPGALYDREADGDTQVDLNANGDPCVQQGYYIDFCYRSAAPHRAPIGGAASAGMQVADLAGDGTPPAGTVVRFISDDILLRPDMERQSPDPESGPVVAVIEGAYPNPFRSLAEVAYRLEAASDVRLAVYDMVGRRVAVLHDGPQAAGAHRTTFEAGGLASGVYLAVLEAGGERRTHRLLLLR